MLKKELLEFVETFIHVHEDDKLSLESTQQTIGELFKKHIPVRNFEELSLSELQDDKEKITNILERKNSVITSSEILREITIKRLEKINKRIEDLTV